MNLNAWLKGLAAAAIGGAVGAGGQLVTNRLQYGRQAPPITGQALGISAGIGALLAAIPYLLQSPVQQMQTQMPQPLPQAQGPAFATPLAGPEVK